MKKYEFVNLKLKNSPPADAFCTEHRQIIEEKAAQGYTYAGYIPAKQGASGKTVEIDLIFFKED